MVLITGASGRIARRTAELLASNGRALRLMTRTPQRVPELARAEVVYGDFAEPASLDRAFAGVTTALVVSGSAEPGKRALLHRNAFEAAARARVQHVVYLSLEGSSPESKYPYSRDHALSEQYLAASGLPFSVLRNAFYIDMFLDMFNAAGVIRGPAKQGRAAFASREDCARVAAATETHLKDTQIGARLREQMERNRGDHLKNRDGGAGVHLFNVFERRGQRRVRHEFAGDTDAFVEAHQVRRSIDVHALPRRLGHRAHEGTGAALAIGAGDMDHRRQSALRVIELLQQHA